MEYIALGKSNLLVSRTAFGAYGLQHIESDEDASSLVLQAYEGGINFFDTSRAKPESERRLGYAIHQIRKDLIIATKTQSLSTSQIRLDLEESLVALDCDYIDLYQIETSSFVPQKNSPDGIYKALLKLKETKKIRHIGIVTDSVNIAKEAVESGLYETIQLPFNMLTSSDYEEVVKLCEERDVGFIAMQPLCGGVIRNIPLAYGFYKQFENAVPLWGFRSQEELQQILYFQAHPPVVDEKFMQEAEQTREFFS
ncbi:MAG: aldo/keto reductase [Spirochaetaceae bacterium]|nr:aldo/keto reductase [Spirochaetaceae bacterium]